MNHKCMLLGLTFLHGFWGIKFKSSCLCNKHFYWVCYSPGPHPMPSCLKIRFCSRLVCTRDWRVDTAVKCVYCSSWRPEFQFPAHTLSSSQAPVTLAPGDPISTSGAHTWTHTHTWKNELSKKFFKNSIFNILYLNKYFKIKHTLTLSCLIFSLAPYLLFNYSRQCPT